MLMCECGKSELLSAVTSPNLEKGIIDHLLFCPVLSQLDELHKKSLKHFETVVTEVQGCKISGKPRIIDIPSGDRDFVHVPNLEIILGIKLSAPVAFERFHLASL